LQITSMFLFFFSFFPKFHIKNVAKVFKILANFSQFYTRKRKRSHFCFWWKNSQIVFGKKNTS
jgi:hypothetical protein